MNDKVRVSERFGSVPSFSIEEFIADNNNLAMPNVEMCYSDIDNAVNNHDKLTDRVEELEKLFYLIKKDLLQRSEKDSDGVSVVGLSHSLWLEVKAISDAWENK